MKAKDIEIGEEYELVSYKKSRPGCSESYFKQFMNSKVLVLKKFNNFYSKNTIKIQVLDHELSQLITFWCSPYDLKG